MDTEPQRLRGFEKSRFEALIDGIFAVALTLLVLDIKLPENIAYPTDDALWLRLISLERHFLIYAISFAVIAMYWIGHHIQFHFVRYTDRPLIWINLLYMLLISFLPFATDLIGDNQDLVLPCEIYGLALLSINGMSCLSLDYLSRHTYLASPELNPTVVRLIKTRIGVLSLVPLASMLVAFYSTHASIYVYLPLALSHFFRGRIDEHIHTTAAITAGLNEK